MLHFDYIEPKTIHEAATFLSSREVRGKILAGGTDVLIQIRDRELTVDRLVSLSKIPGLSFLHSEGEEIGIGAMTTLGGLERSGFIKQSLPVLFDAVEQLGSVQIRNVATLGGNICNAAPSADTIPPLLVLRAQVTYWNAGKTRSVDLSEFFVAPGETILGPGDILMDIRFKRPQPQSSGAYLKFSRRKGMDIPLLGIAVQLQMDENLSFCQDVTIALGVAAPTPIRAKHAEEALRGEKVTDKVLEQVAGLACREARPRDSFRCTAEYRKAMIRALLPAVVRAAFSRIREGEAMQ